jgi:hypothetical protein
MRIAIVCNGRSGSTSLTNLINCCLLSQGKKYSLFFEPFNYRNVDKNNKIKKIDDIVNKENILLKTFIDRDNFPYESFKDVNDYWDWFYTFFDKVIVLERVNKRLQSESLAYHLKISKDKTITPHWHKQKYYDLSIIDENELINLTNHLELDSVFLKEISGKGYPHYTYEKIFVDKDIETITNLLTYLELSYNQKCVDTWVNSPYKKVRLDEKTNKLL